MNDEGGSEEIRNEEIPDELPDSRKGQGFYQSWTNTDRVCSRYITIWCYQYKRKQVSYQRTY